MCISRCQVRIMFEVQDLKFATLATVSRCGMVWFSEDVLSSDMIFENFLTRLRNVSVEEGEEEAPRKAAGGPGEEVDISPTLQVTYIILSISSSLFYVKYKVYLISFTSPKAG